MDKNKNTVRRNCPFYDDDEACKKLQPKRNCYQCVLSNVEILKKDFYRLIEHRNKIEQENKDLKFLIGEKILKEYQEGKIETVETVETII